MAMYYTSKPDHSAVRCCFIGATLPALWLATEISKHGFIVSILEDRSHIAHAQELRQLGLLQTGLLDNYWRLAQGLGEPTAKEIHNIFLQGASIVHSILQRAHKAGCFKETRRERA